MVQEKCGARLMAEERCSLQQLITIGRSSGRVTTRNRSLLKTNEGWPAPRVPKPWMWAWARCSAPSDA